MNERFDEYRTALGVMDMIRLLEASPERSRPVNWLAEKLEVDRRTIRRWAAGLQNRVDDLDGLPKVTLSPGTPAREAVVQLSRQPKGATNAQQRAAALALAATRYLASTGAEPLEELAERLIGSQAGHDKDTIRRLKSAFHYIPFGGKSYVEKSDEVDAVFSAVIYRWTLDFDYWLVEPQRRIRVRAEPYSLVIYRDALYMLGRRLGVGEPVMRVYAIDRMSEPKSDRAARFEVPANFDPADCFGDLGLWNPDRARERLEVLFTVNTARHVREREWPGFVAWHAEPDDRQRLILEIRISSEVEQWLLGFGPEAEVIAPTWLRDAMHDRAKRMALLYEESPPNAG